MMPALHLPVKSAEKPVLLLVDDEPRILRTLEALFSGFEMFRSYDILTAHAASAGLEIINSRRVALVITDQQMPEMSGADFLREASKRAPETMRMLLTGYSDLNAVVQTINTGDVFRIIPKPWDSQKLVKTVALACEIYERRQLARGLSLQSRRTYEQVKPSPAVSPATSPKPSARPATLAALRTFDGLFADRQAVRPEFSLLGGGTPDDGSATPISKAVRPAELQQIKPQPTAAVLPELCTVLFLSESTANRERFSLLFKDQPNYHVAVADTTSIAFDFLQHQSASVLVCDIEAGNIELIEFLVAIRQTQPDLQTMLVSKAQDAGQAVRLINDGHIFRYLAKPVTAGAMRTSLAEAAAHHVRVKADPVQNALRQEQQMTQAPFKSPTSVKDLLLDVQARLRARVTY